MMYAIVGLCRDAVSKAKKRYDVGLEKLEFATQQVNTMQKELEDLQPVLEQSQEATRQLMEVIQAKLPGRRVHAHPLNRLAIT